MLDYVDDQKKNFTNDVNGFMGKLRAITQFEYFMLGSLGEFKNRYSIPFSLVLTKHGICFNFNREPAESMFHLDK